LNNQLAQAKAKKKKILFGVIGILVLIGIILAIVLPLTLKKHDSDPTSSPTDHPTSGPTVGPFLWPEFNPYTVDDSTITGSVFRQEFILNFAPKPQQDKKMEEKKETPRSFFEKHSRDDKPTNKDYRPVNPANVKID